MSPSYTGLRQPTPKQKPLQLRLALTLPKAPCMGFNRARCIHCVSFLSQDKTHRRTWLPYWGPRWREGADIHKQCRMYLLMSPPQGSLAKFLGDATDEGSVGWTRRLPGVEEEDALSKQREFNRVIKEQGLRLHLEREKHTIQGLGIFGVKCRVGLIAPGQNNCTLGLGFRMNKERSHRRGNCSQVDTFCLNTACLMSSRARMILPG